MVIEVAGAIAVISAVVMALNEVFKRLPIKTLKDAEGKFILPKTFAMLFAVIIIGGTALVDNKFTVENAPAIATSIGAVSVTAYGLYDVTKTFVKAMNKVFGKIADWFANRQ